MKYRLVTAVLVTVIPWLSVPPEASSQFWELDMHFLVEYNQEDQRIGQGVALGDFDGDGLDDLFYGAPGWDEGSDADVGMVCWRRTLPGRSFAPSTCGTYSTPGGKWGRAAAAADFDGDGRDEVAFGGPHVDVEFEGSSIETAGRVVIFDFDPSTEQWTEGFLDQTDTLSFSGPEIGDGFGEVLTTGDFDGDGYADLAVGVPFEDLGQGIVQVFYGSASGIQPSVHQGFHAGSGGVLGTRSGGEHTGWALAAGDFDDDGHDDLAFSAPDRPLLGSNSAGQVHVLYGTATGLDVAGQQLLSSWSFPGIIQSKDFKRFGRALAAGNFDGGLISCLLGACYDDLAIGVPGEWISGLQFAGRVRVVPGSASGLDPNGVTNLSSTDTDLAPEEGGWFGVSLTAGRADPDFPDDLAVGSLDSSESELHNEGRVSLFFGSSSGIDGDRPPQEIPFPAGVTGLELLHGDGWGRVLRLGDLDGDGWGDLVVGVPWKDASATEKDLGGVAVLYGALFADGFERGDLTSWSATSP